MSERARIISDDAVDRALEWLRANAIVIGKAKERAVLAEKLVGHTEALLMKASNASSADARKAEARASEQYYEAIVEDAKAAGELAKLYSLREAAAARIECWRTEQSNFRAMKI
jgi:hypothetical protein